MSLPSVCLIGLVTFLCSSAFSMAQSVPLSSSTRPFIWAKMSERTEILNKIENHTWAKSKRDKLIARVQGNLDSYLSNRDAYLRALPVNWSLSSPRYYTTETQVNSALRNKLDIAQDCSVIYYLTGDERYGALAADVLHNAIRWFPNTPKSSNTSIGGWTFHDREWLYESRSIGSPMPIIYDFMHGFLQNRTVYDVKTQTMVSFDFTSAQNVFKDFRNLCRDRGYAGTNWSALMGDCMILNTLALDNVTTRNTYVSEFLYTDFTRQDSIKTQNAKFDGPAPYSCYPESLGYSKGVVERDSYYISLLDRYDPSKNYPAAFPKLIQSLHRTKQMHFPNISYQVQFGDGHRMTGGGIDYHLADILYSQAKKQGRTDQMAINGGLLADGIASGKYNRSSLSTPDSLGIRDQILPLLWGTAEINETPKELDIFRTDTLPYAGLALQRNFSPNGNVDDAMMCFVQGAGFVHSHASGMNMELYGEGRVLGVKGYGRSDYARAFASANTVIVNGYSRGSGGWVGIGINTVQLEAMEPAARANPVSANMSFSSTTFADNKGDGAEATQKRTMAIVRTSPTTGFYFDLFRSNSSKSGQYHDYLYHNVGDTLTVTDSSGAPLSFTNQPNRFQNDTDGNRSPGWGFLTGTRATGTVTDFVRAQFKSRFNGETSDIYMDMHIPGDSAREYATAMGPSDGEHPAPYDNKDIPTLIVRKNGQAWDNPFSVIYEPHRAGVDGGTVQNVSPLEKGTKVVGMRVESIVNGEELTHYIIANTGPNDVYEDPAIGLYFKGRFAIASHREDGSGELYIGEGATLSYGPLKVESNSGNNTQVSVLFDENLTTTVTSNAAVTVTQTGLSFTPVLRPIAHWPLDEGSGTIVENVADTPFTAVIENGATWGSDATRETYVSFDGTDGRIATTFTYALKNTDDFTWAWWANKQSPPGTKNGSIMVGSRYGNTGAESLEFIKMTPSKASFSNTNNANQIEDYDYEDLPTGQWRHYAMVKSGTSYQWYIDGAAQGSPVTINYNETTPIPFHIGGDGVNKPNEYFQGFMDDVVLYRKALTAPQVSSVMNGIYEQVVTMVALGSPQDSTIGATWSDGKPAHAGARYVVPATGNLRGESGSSSFPGSSLTIESGGRYQVRSLESNGEVNTVDELVLEGGSSFTSGNFAELAAGSGTDATNVLAGTIANSGYSRFLSFGTSDGSPIARNLRVQSLITGFGRIQALEGSGQTLSSVFIDHPENSFFGTWEVASGSQLVFANAGAVGTANVEVMAGGVLEIKGNWNTGTALAVSTNSGTNIKLGAYGWMVSDLFLGNISVDDGVYTAADLNTLAANPVFTGLGTITVGEGLPGGPIAHWRLNEGSGTTAIDSSGGGKTGILLPGASFINDPTRGTVVSFNGSTGRITTPFTYALSSSDNFTWTWWANKQSPVGSDNGAIMVGNRYGGSGSQSLEFIKFMPQKATFVNGGLTDREDYNYTDIVNDGWHHYAMVKMGTEYRWYVDGVLEARVPAGPINYSETDALPINIGGDDDDAIAGGREMEHFTGLIDDVALYDRPLTPAEVQAVRNGSYGFLPPNTAQEDWREFYFGITGNTGNAADDKDPDFDGESNLLEFATGQDPFAGTLIQTSLTTNGANLEFRYTRSNAASGDGIQFTVEWSDTLLPGSWSSAGVTDTAAPEDPENPGNSEIENRIARMPAGPSGRRFIHLKVSGP